MAHRIDVETTIPDVRANVREKELQNLGFAVEVTRLVDSYVLDKEFSDTDLERIAKSITNPVTEKSLRNERITPENFDWSIEIGFLPGVTDNVGATVRESIEELVNKRFESGEGVYSSQVTYIKGNLSREQVQQIAQGMANSLIQRIHITSREEFLLTKENEPIMPRVLLTNNSLANIVNLECSDEELSKIGKKGIPEYDSAGKLKYTSLGEEMRRGPLALDLSSMIAIRDYFRKKGRAPTDVEIEALAQTWSEHCKHTIFADPMDEIKDGLFTSYI